MALSWMRAARAQLDSRGALSLALGGSVNMISLQPRFPDRAIEAWRRDADALWIARTTATAAPAAPRSSRAVGNARAFRPRLRSSAYLFAAIGSAARATASRQLRPIVVIGGPPARSRPRAGAGNDA
jgi:hypothetical protein